MTKSSSSFSRRRVISIFFLLVLTFDLFTPLVGYALTAGPTAPEATSFEPVDTTDMVNLHTGDLAYNIPLLEVPGPAGSYPLSISNHAGLMMDEEASWVGLGWTLNPGAINRNVNGYSDDYSNEKNSNHFFWEGGIQEVYDIGVTLGIAGVVGPTAGLSIGNDTYQGFGVGFELGYNASIFGIEELSAGARFGMDPWGNAYASAGLGLKIGEGVIHGNTGLGIAVSGAGVSGYASGGVGVSYNGSKKQNNGSAEQTTPPADESKAPSPPLVRIMPQSGGSLAGGSISTRPGGGFETSGSIGGFTAGSNLIGKISTASGGFTLPLPLVTLGYRYTRYWIDQTEDVFTNGSLYFPTSSNFNSTWYDTHSYDAYTLQSVGGYLGGGDPNRGNGGTFPAFDSYSVSAQGVNGSIRPYFYQKYLVKDNTKRGDDYDLFEFPLGANSGAVGYRFANEFSNQYQYSGGQATLGSTLATALGYTFGTPTTGENGTSGFVNNRLIGTKHIEYYLNSAIKSNQSPNAFGQFIETKSTGFDRSQTPNSQVGAFTITNESGVQYHFSLPAYAHSEYQYSENRSDANGDTYNEITRDGKYAYTWLLTAVTGPDYVDRGAPGLSSDDWGYWVEFEYGKWTDMYSWRNPSEGSGADVDQNFANFSEGKKEIYYLDAIRTGTHTAFFIKDIRHDGKGSIFSIRNRENIRNENKSKVTNSDVALKGGFTPKKETVMCYDHDFHLPQGLDTIDLGYLTYYPRPTNAMKLVSIYLVKNDDVSGISIAKSNGLEYQRNYEASWQVLEDDGQTSTFCNFANVQWNHHLYQNVLDVYDMGGTVGTQLRSKSTKVIDLTTSYSLVPETVNSYDDASANVTQPDTASTSYPRLGKLTLDAISTKGHGGASLLPPTRFYYDLEHPKQGVASITKPAGSGESDFQLSQANTGLAGGDIVRINSNSNNCYALVTSTASTFVSLRIIGSKKPTSNTIVSWIETKNPPYNKEFFDHWNMYKSDYAGGDDSNLSRLPTNMSAKQVDAWSLRRIESPLGATINIEYGSDSYSQSVLYRNGSLKFTSMTDPDTNNGTAKLIVPGAGDFLDDIIKVGSQIDINFIANVHTGGSPGTNSVYASTQTLNVTEVGTDYVKFYLPWFVNQYFSAPEADPKHTLYCGNIFTKNDFNMNGGGIRVESVSVYDGLKGITNKTSYDYLKPGTSLSSGVTSYEPVGISNFSFCGYSAISQIGKDYKQLMLSRFSNLLINARSVPPPGVMYEYITMKESVIDANGTYEIGGKSTYQFEVLKDGMIGSVVTTESSASGLGTITYAGQTVNNQKRLRNRVEIRDYTAMIGNLKKITLYDTEGRKISETTNHYLHDDVTYTPYATPSDIFAAYNSQYETLLAKFNGQGIMEETYVTSRLSRDTAQNHTNEHVLFGVVSQMAKYQPVQTGTTTINYKTGISTKSEVLSFDYYSGQATKTLTTDGYGNSYIAEIVPAYKVSAYSSAFGPTLSGGKNILTNEALTYSYKVEPYPNTSAPITNTNYRAIGLGSMAAQTYSNTIPVLSEGTQSGIWRKHASFVYIGNDATALRDDGLHTLTSYTLPTFGAWNRGDAVPGYWQRNSEITLYDVQSHALEAKDLNGDFAATKMSLSQTKVFATLANGEYREFAYSGAEELPGPGGTLGGGITLGLGRNSSAAHTGSYSAIADPSSGSTKKGFIYSFSANAGTYRVSVWADHSDAYIKYKVNSGIEQTATVANRTLHAGSWYLLETDITVTGTPTLEIWSEANSANTLFDDFRVHPFDAAMVSYVYNDWDELSHILDNNNLYTEYRYDQMGRLIETYKETLIGDQPSVYGTQGIVKVSEINYNYGQNTPYTLPITLTKTGTSGTVFPATTVNIIQGDEQTFEIRETCTSPKLFKIKVDGSEMSLSTGNYTLADNTQVLITALTSSFLVRFKNLQSAHSLGVEFNAYAVGTGGTQCHVTSGCPNGRFDYYIINGCGVADWTYNVLFNSIPASIRPATQPDCCVNVPQGCNCQNIQY